MLMTLKLYGRRGGVVDPKITRTRPRS